MNHDPSTKKERATAVVKALIVGACIAASAAAGACNTTEGLGQDIENLGDNIEDAASDSK